MRKFSYIIAALLVVLASEGFAQKSIPVNAENSTVKWVGGKLGGSHDGFIKINEGGLQFDGEQLVGGSFSMDMTSIEVTDLSGDKKGNLEGHLKSDDFFGSSNFPKALLNITRVIPQGKEIYKIEADLTIKDIKKPVKFIANVKLEGGKYTATTDFSVDRSEYNVKYKSGSFFDDLGDKVIYDDFDLKINLVSAD